VLEAGPLRDEDRYRQSCCAPDAVLKPHRPDACVLDGEIFGRLNCGACRPRELIAVYQIELVEAGRGDSGCEQRIARDLPGEYELARTRNAGSSAASKDSASGTLGNSRIRRTRACATASRAWSRR
jgi:hypothetical protein